MLSYLTSFSASHQSLSCPANWEGRWGRRGSELQDGVRLGSLLPGPGLCLSPGDPLWDAPAPGLNPQASVLVPRGRAWEMGGGERGERECPSTPDLPLPSSQLVAGIKYYLTVEMGSTACRKSSVTGDRMDLTTCPLAAGAQEEVRALHSALPTGTRALRLSSLNWSGQPD